MSMIRRETAPDRLRRVTADLAAHGIDVPAEVAAQVQRVDSLEKAPPVAVTIQDLTAALLEQKPPKELDRLALLNVTHAARAEAWREARISAAQAGLAALSSYGNDLTTQLAALAAPLIQAVHATAAIDTHDVSALLRHNREDDARMVSDYPNTCGRLQALYSLRGKVTRGADYGESPELVRATGYVGASCAVWRDPRKVGRTAGNASAADYWRDGIKAGGELWFPLPAEAESHARAIVEEIRAAERDAAAENAHRSFRTGMGAPR